MKYKNFKLMIGKGPIEYCILVEFRSLNENAYIEIKIQKRLD